MRDVSVDRGGFDSEPQDAMSIAKGGHSRNRPRGTSFGPFPICARRASSLWGASRTCYDLIASDLLESAKWCRNFYVKNICPPYLNRIEQRTSNWDRRQRGLLHLSTPVDLCLIAYALESSHLTPDAVGRGVSDTRWSPLPTKCLGKSPKVGCSQPVRDMLGGRVTKVVSAKFPLRGTRCR